MRRLIVFLIAFLFCLPAYPAQKVEIDYPATPIITNLTLTSANTEYSHALPATTNKFLVQCRTAFAMKLSFISGESGTTYITIKADTWYFENGIEGTRRTLYIQSAEAGVIAEILTWDD